MNNNTRFTMTFCVVTVAAAYVSGWLLTSDDSPFSVYFLHNVFLPNVWRSLNVMPFILGMLVGGNLHAETEAGVVVMVAAFVGQWALVGYGLSKVVATLGNGLR